MPFRNLEPWLAFFAEYTLQLKMFLAATLSSAAFLADLAGEMKGIDDLGVKAILVGALIWLMRLYQTQQTEHKAEMRETLSAAKKAQEDNTKALNDLTSLTREQTDYFKAVTRTIVDEKIKSSTRNTSL